MAPPPSPCLLACVAVHELLLTEAGQLSSGNGVDALHGTRGSKGPAGATATLVLHLRVYGYVHT